MELAATVCLLGWKRRTGSLKARECREFLEKIQGGLVLPAKRPTGKATEVPVTARGEPGARLVGTARDLGEIRLQRVQRLEQRRLFRELVGVTTIGPPGAVRGASALSGLRRSRRWWPACSFRGPGGLRCATAGLDGRRTRARQLVHVVSNSRYLVLPWVQVKNLASRIFAGRAAAGGGLAPELRGRGVFGGDRWIRGATGGAAIGGRTGSSWGAPGAGSGRIG